MVDNLGTLTNPQQYIDYYYEDFKDRLNSRGLLISKVGFIGFFLHILGFTQFDIKQYYDTLFMEAFLASAVDDGNLNLHGVVHGYNPIIANPASAEGTYKVKLDSIPAPTDGAIREVVLKNLQFKIGDNNFISEATYTIRGTSCEIRKGNGETIYVPYNIEDQTVPIFSLYQYLENTISFALPYYQKGTYYQKLIDLQGTGEVSEIKVYIKISEEDGYEEYQVSTVKYFSTSTDKSVFLRRLQGNKLVIEFGSGMHGLYVSQGQVEIQIKQTNGSAGNISRNVSSPYGGTVKILDIGEYGSAFSVSPSTMVEANIEFSEAGVNSLTGEDLRNSIIAFIQSRENMVSEIDFYNILGRYVDDFLLMFKKTNPVENTIYLFTIFRDQYQVPILSKSVSVTHETFNPFNSTYIYKPTFELDGVWYISPFYYEFDSFMRDYPAYIYFETFSTYFTNIETFVEDSDSVSISPLPLSLHFEFVPDKAATRISAQSYQTINEYVMYCSIPVLDFYECMDVFDDNIQEVFYSTEGGMIRDCVDILIEVYQYGSLMFIYSVQQVCLTGDISDILELKIYEHPATSWDICGGNTGGTGGLGEEGGPFNLIHMTSHLLNIPVMQLEQYDSNQAYYDAKFYAAFSNFTGDENRMLSDDIQMRFINTEYIEPDILKVITVQEHDFRMLLPLRLVIDAVAYKYKVIDQGIETAVIIDDLKIALAAKLFDVYTGTEVSFYRTQIVDIIHNLDWVKHCSVRVYDSNPAENEITDANIELRDQEAIIEQLGKFDAVTYCPAYLWWDLDNIEINLDFE